MQPLPADPGGVELAMHGYTAQRIQFGAQGRIRSGFTIEIRVP